MLLSNKKYFFGDLFVNVCNKKDLLEKIKKAVLNEKKITFGYLHAASFYYDQKDGLFRKALTSFNYIYLNSFYLGKMLERLYKKKFKKINAEDFFYNVCSLANKNRWKIMLLGSDKNTNIKAVKKIKDKYKKLNISGHKGYFEYDKEVVDFINNKAPKIIFVGLGTGYQEEWIYKNLKRINHPCITINIGNFIDVLGGKSQLPPQMMKNLKLEWLWRLIEEPKRLAKRYFFGGITVFSLFIKNLSIKKVNQFC